MSMFRVSNIKVELDSGKRRSITVAADNRTLADALAGHGLPLNTRCGQRGICRGCEVELREGWLLVDGSTITAPGTVKACRARVAGDAAIHLPSRSRIEHKPQVGETFEIAVPYAHQPLFPFVSGQRDTAFAVDVGTTTVVVLLVDLVTGEVLSRAGAFNEQIRFGDNVVTRIEAARTPDNLTAMQRAIVMETIEPLLRRACVRAGRALDRIAGGAIAGNTTMLHLLVGEDPTPLGIAPFTPRFIEGRQVWMTLDPFQLATETIGNVPLARANGLCGSAYVDFLATARSSGLLGVAGRFQPAAWETIPVQNRHMDDGERALRLTETDGAGALRVSEVDVALLLQAKAAIGAGIEILLETAGIRAADLDRVYLAGGFGMHLNVAHAIAIGLLPGFREEQVRVVGNTSLAGALLASVDRTTLVEMENLRSQMEVIELNLAPDFEDRYIEHLMLP